MLKDIGGVIIISKIIDNYLENKKQDYGQENINSTIALYEDIPNERLKYIFSKIHSEINLLFKYLNSRLSYGHYTADASRSLIK